MPNYFKIVQYLQVAHLHCSIHHFFNDDPQYQNVNYTKFLTITNV